VTPAVSQLPFVQILNVGLDLYRPAFWGQHLPFVAHRTARKEGFGCLVYTDSVSIAHECGAVVVHRFV
jgi:hypothetical protein